MQSRRFLLVSRTKYGWNWHGPKAENKAVHLGEELRNSHKRSYSHTDVAQPLMTILLNLAGDCRAEYWSRFAVEIFENTKVFVHRLLPIQSHNCLTSGPSAPSTLPPTTVTETLTSSICVKSNLPSPPSPSHSFSSPMSRSFMPESKSPLVLKLLTLVISDSRAAFTSGAGSAVNKSSLFAATSTGNSVGPLGDFVLALFCSKSNRSCRYSAACRKASLPVPLLLVDMSAASTINMMPLRFCGLITLSNAWCRSLPCPGVSASKNFLWIWFEGSLADLYRDNAVVVVTGRETSTVRGAWEVRVSACRPRSNCQ